MSIDEIKARLELRVEECHRRVTAVHPRFPKVACTLFSGRRAAGLAFGNEHRIALNEVLLRENPEPMLRDTWYRRIQPARREELIAACA